ncbi:MAG: hypothetical protein R3B96_15165 [Pirellulaceae bacterium]
MNKTLREFRQLTWDSALADSTLCDRIGQVRGPRRLGDSRPRPSHPRARGVVEYRAQGGGRRRSRNPRHRGSIYDPDLSVTLETGDGELVEAGTLDREA